MIPLRRRATSSDAVVMARTVQSVMRLLMAVACLTICAITFAIFMDRSSFYGATEIAFCPSQIEGDFRTLFEAQGDGPFSISRLLQNIPNSAEARKTSQRVVGGCSWKKTVPDSYESYIVHFGIVDDEDVGKSFFVAADEEGFVRFVDSRYQYPK